MEEKAWGRSEISAEFFDLENVGEVIRHLEEKYWSENKVICGVFINGQYMDEEKDVLMYQKNLVDISNFKILVSTVRDLVKENSQTIVERIGGVEELTHSLLNLKISGDQSEAEKSMVDLVTYLHSVIENLNLLKQTMVNNGLMPSDSTLASKWQRLESLLAPTVTELLESYEAKDHVLLNDILEYDLLDIMKSWRELLQIHLIAP